MMLAGQATSTRGGTDDPKAIQEALGGHVCRCTGYVEDHRGGRGGGARRLVRPHETAVGKYTTMTTGGAE